MGTCIWTELSGPDKKTLSLFEINPNWIRFKKPDRQCHESNRVDYVPDTLVL